MTSYSNQRWSTKYYTEWTSRCVYHTMVGLSATTPSPQPGYLVRKVCGYGYPAGWKTKPVKGRWSSLWDNHHPYLMSNCVCSRPPAVGWLFLEGWWQDLHSSHRKTLHSAKPTNTTKTENPLRGSTSSAAAIHREANRMRDWGKVFGTPIYWW